jgi:hypothetical protein
MHTVVEDAESDSGAVLPVPQLMLETFVCATRSFPGKDVIDQFVIADCVFAVRLVSTRLENVKRANKHRNSNSNFLPPTLCDIIVGGCHKYAVIRANRRAMLASSMDVLCPKVGEAGTESCKVVWHDVLLIRSCCGWFLNIVVSCATCLNVCLGLVIHLGQLDVDMRRCGHLMLRKHLQNLDEDGFEAA